jgi:Ca2+-binding RTX toxin-like protein
MRGRAALLFTAMTAALMIASGVALADNIRCKAFQDCFGSNRSDTMRGTPKTDFMFALAGNDTMKGNDSWDQLEGGKGADKIYGMRGDDAPLWGGHAPVFDNTENYSDTSNDYVQGGEGADLIYAGYAQGGVDRVYGGDGDDRINAEQRSYVSDGYNMEVTKEIVDCGPGDDTVTYDEGLDVLLNCENVESPTP